MWHWWTVCVRHYVLWWVISHDTPHDTSHDHDTPHDTSHDTSHDTQIDNISSICECGTGGQSMSDPVFYGG